MTRDPSLVSIIIPVYKQEKELILALDSIFEQTYKQIETIVVDDGGTVDLKKVISKIPKYQTPVHFEVMPENKGAGAARNVGALLARGNYLLFWDADIVGDPTMIEKMKRALDEHPDASFAYSNFHWGWKKIRAQAYNSDALKKTNYITTTSLLRRVDFVGFDQTLKRFIDWDLWLTLAEQEKHGVWIDEYLFRIKPGGSMSEWLPRLAYTKPWRAFPGIKEKVARYEAAREVICKKHRLS